MHRHDFRNLVAVGAGTMGRQIAVAAAAHGFRVALQDVSPSALESARREIEKESRRWAGLGSIPESSDDILARVRYTREPADAAEDADLLIESAPEKLALKREVFRVYANLCPPKTIFTTNSSYLLPSSLAASSGRPAQFAALHFHSPIRVGGVVDVMGHRQTSPDTVERLLRFARDLDQLPIIAARECPGYVFNALLFPLLTNALGLAAKGVASIEDIDRAWMGVMRTPIGPFGILDGIGLDTVHDILGSWKTFLRDPNMTLAHEWLGRNVRARRLGTKTNAGFYDYPHPAWSRDDFLHDHRIAAKVALADARERLESQETSPGERGQIERLAMCAEPQPLHPRVRPKMVWSGRVAILGDGEAAEALERGLAAAGAPSLARISPRQPLDDLLRQWDDHSREQEIVHLFLLSALDEDVAWRGGAPDRVIAEEQCRRCVANPYFLLQHWFRRLRARRLLDDATLTAASRLGGQSDTSTGAPLGGGFSGLLKAVMVEGAVSGSLGPRVVVVDVAPDASVQEAAEILLRETAIAQASVVAGSTAEFVHRYAAVDIAHHDGRRFVRRVRRAPLSRVPEENAAALESLRDTNWIVTGGASGITAHVARRLAERLNLTLHLFGRTRVEEVALPNLSGDDLASYKAEVMKRAFAEGNRPDLAWNRVLKQREMRRNFEAMRAAGVAFEYHAVDVADPSAVDAAFENLRRRRIPIQGILHGAGVEVVQSFWKKTPDVVEATLGPKSSGALSLMRAAMAEPLRAFVAFGSVGGCFPRFGQTDYCQANALLGKLTAWYRRLRPECRCLTIHWPGWAEIGMAARRDSHRGLEHIGHHFLTPDEGASLFMSELAAGAPDAEVMFLDPRELPSCFFHESRSLLGGSLSHE